MWSRVVEQQKTILEEVPEIIAADRSEEHPRNRSGFSPKQWLLGFNGRLDWDDHDDNMYHFASPDTK